MSVALQKILGHTPLTEALRTVASGVPNPFPDELFTVSEGAKLLGDRAHYIRISGERRTMKRNEYGAPAKRRSLRDIGDQYVRMLHEFESFPIDFMVMQQLRSFEKYEQDKGMDWLNYQIEEASRRQKNSRIITTASVLRHGAIYWDSNGNLLPNSGGADSNYTIDMAIPASHKNQCNGIISAPWSLVNTDISLQVANIQQFSLQETGMRLTTALYGINIPSYIRQNNTLQAFMSRDPGYNPQMMATNEIPQGLMGIEKWIPVYTSFYETDDIGTVAEIWDDDLIVFLPNIDQPDKMTWWKMFEGSMPVPRTLDVNRDPMATFRSAEIVYGQGGYAAPTVNPPSMECYTFDTFLPTIRNEKAVFMADTVF